MATSKGSCCSSMSSLPSRPSPCLQGGAARCTDGALQAIAEQCGYRSLEAFRTASGMSSALSIGLSREVPAEQVARAWSK